MNYDSKCKNCKKETCRIISLIENDHISYVHIPIKKDTNACSSCDCKKAELKEYRKCKCGHSYESHQFDCTSTICTEFVSDKLCSCDIKTLSQLIEREIKAEREKIFDEINTQLHSRLIGTWYCDVHGKSELQYYPCCDKATFDEEGRYDWIWQALDQAKKNLMYSDEPR